MARFDGGWVKLHRKVIDSDIGRNFLLLGLWLTLIRWANWTESKVNWRGTPRTLGRGEMLTSFKELADYGEVDRKTVAKWLNYLALRGSIEVEKSPKGSQLGLIIKVLNYEKYQSLDALYSPDTGLEPGHEPPRSLDTYKETKNIRTKESKKRDATASLPPLAQIWNSNCGDLAKVQKSNKARNQKADLRLSENSPEEWVAIVKRIAQSEFCCGANDRGWKATFDWLLQPETHLKVAEGKYDTQGAGGNQPMSIERAKRLLEEGA